MHAHSAAIALAVAMLRLDMCVVCRADPGKHSTSAGYQRKEDQPKERAQDKTRA